MITTEYDDYPSHLQLYFMSEFCNLFARKGILGSSPDITSAIDKAQKNYDLNLRHTDSKLSPKWNSDHLILLKNDKYDRIIGYQTFILHKPSSNCVLFEIYVEEKLRKNGIASQLIEEAVDWSVAQGIKTFTTTLLKDASDKEPALAKVFNELSIKYARVINFKITAKDK